MFFSTNKTFHNNNFLGFKIQKKVILFEIIKIFLGTLYVSI